MTKRHALRAAVWAGAVATLGCAAGPAAHSPTTVKLDAPAPTPTSAASPPPRATETERARLEAACFAEPWTAKDSRFAPKALSAEQSDRLRGLMDPSGCHDRHPGLPPGRFAAGTPIPPAECHYGIARLHFESQHWTEAARWFRRVAVEHARADVGVFAAQLALESLNVLASHAVPARTECYQLLAQDAELFACLYCSRAENQEPCAMLRRVRFDVRHLLATGAMPSSAGEGSCGPDERAVAGRCEALPPLVPAGCAR